MHPVVRALAILALLVAACAQGSPPPEGTDAGRRDAGDAPMDAMTMDDGAVAGDAGPCSEIPETCNGADDDCDGTVDEEPTDGTTFYRDLDGDGWGSDTDTVVACARPDNAVERSGDCQDGSDLVNPDSMETCDGLDNDCSDVVDDAGCPAGCTGVAFGGKGYAFCAASVSWTAARDACVAAGMQLVRVDNMMENDFLFATASMPGGIGDHFIGARVEDDGTRRWRWTDGTELWEGLLGGSAIDGRFAAWESDQPDDDAAPRCAVARAREMGLWQDTSCDTGNDYVCERY
ncbi:MAG: hypothetical protein H6719_30785 [Sandaracinaceae bacterium]|nr:hypothetical protein [Sandaracinaceae bacterium]